jgi:putative Holliday junction resolvase
MRKGRRLAVDVGKARVGLAISDQDGILASPFATVARLESLEDTARAILAATDDYFFSEIYVGYPLSLNGKPTPSTDDAVALASAVAGVFDVDVRLIDERLTTVTASANLRLAGKNAKNSRSIIDQEAAAIILESALAGERATGTAPGKLLADYLAETEGDHE